MVVFRNSLLCGMLLVSVFGHATKYYVDNSNLCASNSNNGLSFTCVGADGPLSSIEYATTLLTDGDSIVIGQGTYFEHPFISTHQNITIVPYGNGMVTVSGAMEPFTVPNNGLWTDEGMRFSAYHNTSFRVFSASYPSGVVPSAIWTNTLSQNMAVDDNGRKMYTYADTVLFNLRHEPDVDGICFDHDKMYVSFLDPSKDPNDVGLYISRFWDVFNFNTGSEVTMDGGPNKMMTVDHGGRFVIKSEGGARMTLRNLMIKNGNNGVYENPSAGSSLIENCEFYGGHDSLWTWAGVKYCYGNPGGDHTLSGCYVMPDLSTNPNAISGTVSHESSAVMFYGDTATHVVRNCKIQGYFNGVVVTGGDGIVENNEISDIYDDAIEPEGDLSLIIRNNAVSDVFVCHAGVTTHNGPVYVYENIYCGNKNVVYSYDFVNDIPGDVWYGRPMKYYGNSLTDLTTNTHFYYNTFYGDRTPLLIGAGGCLPANKATNSSVYNNIFLSEDNISSRSGEQVDGIEIRSNLFHTTGSPAFKYSCWNGGGDWNVLPPMPASWTANQEDDPLFNGGNVNAPLDYFKIGMGSPSRVVNGFDLEPIPVSWAGATDLNSNRTNGGALEYDSGIGILENDQSKFDIQVFPNPSSGLMVVSNQDFGFQRMVLFNSIGKEVLIIKLSGEKKKVLNLSNYASGLYFLQVEVLDHVVTKPIVIEE